MTSFKPIRFDELKDINSAKAENKQFPKLPVGTNQVVEKTAKLEVTSFNLHPLVAGQLDVTKKKKEENERQVKAEIERRWQISKEKAEVEGYTEGLNLGKREAIAAEMPKIQNLLDRLNHILYEIDSMKESLWKENEKFLMNLIAQIVRVITLKEVELDTDYVKRLVFRLVDQISSKEDLKIFISDMDKISIDELSQEISKKFSELKNISILSDPDLLPGSCKIETNSVVIDASLEEQIKNAVDVLKNKEADKE